MLGCKKVEISTYFQIIDDFCEVGSWIDRVMFYSIYYWSRVQYMIHFRYSDKHVAPPDVYLVKFIDFCLIKEIVTFYLIWPKYKLTIGPSGTIFQEDRRG